ncbi:MAG: ROK family protein [Planctomycetales bacterium]|nr:ROK family protein [Planctomycetales bacterium]MCA9171284.1 ROK family protein [Planctomycetales bacterium]
MKRTSTFCLEPNPPASGRDDERLAIARVSYACINLTIVDNEANGRTHVVSHLGTSHDDQDERLHGGEQRPTAICCGDLGEQPCAIIVCDGQPLSLVISSAPMTPVSRTSETPRVRRILAVDVGGTHIKVKSNQTDERRAFKSGAKMTAQKAVDHIRKLVADWQFDAVSIGIPAPVVHGRVLHDPKHLGEGWVGFDFSAAFETPVKVINDAAMQAWGSYRGGRMLFLGLGTGLGSAMIVNGLLAPMELAHLPFKKGTFEDYVGENSLKRAGKVKWSRFVFSTLACLRKALEPEYVVLGGGNVRLLGDLPAQVERGANDNAFVGGFRLWDAASA